MIVCREQYPYRIIVVFKSLFGQWQSLEHRVQNEHPSSMLFIRGGGVPSSNSDIICRRDGRGQVSSHNPCPRQTRRVRPVIIIQADVYNFFIEVLSVRCILVS